MRRLILLGMLGLFSTAVPIALAVSATSDTKASVRGIQYVLVVGRRNIPINAAMKELIVQGCFVLVSEADAADAVLAIKTDGMPGSRDWTAEATLSLKSGGEIWSKEVRFDDAPYSAISKRSAAEAGRIIARALARDAGCR